MKLFRKKGFYIALNIFFTLLLAFSLVVRFTVSERSEMPDFSGMPGGFSSEDGEMPQRPSFSSDGTAGGSSDDSGMPDFGSFPGGSMPDSDSFSRDEGAQSGFLSFIRKIWLPLAIVSLLGDAAAVFGLLRLRRANTAAVEAPAGDIPDENPPRRSKKKVWLAILALVLVASLLLALLTRSSTVESKVEVVESVLSAAAEKGELTRSLVYGGSLAESDTEEVALAGSVRLTGWAVEDGDYVEEGDLLATVDMNSVLSAISDVTEMMDELDAALESSRSDAASATVTAPIAGRIKNVYAAVGEKAEDTLYKNGALFTLSLDGRMAVDIENDSLSVGSVLNVTLTDGTALPGTVYSVSDGTVTVTVSDTVAAPGETVMVSDESGAALGQGELYIHSEMKVMAYAGTVSSVYVRENAAVTAGQTLAALTDTTLSGRYNELLLQRADLEAQLRSLFTVYKSGGLYADCAGWVSGLNEDIVLETSASELSAASSGGGIRALLSIRRAPSVLREEELIEPPMTNGEPPAGEPTGEPSGEPAGEETGTVEYTGRVTAIDDTESGKALSLTLFSDSSVRTVLLSDLTGKCGSTEPESIQIGDILTLVCSNETDEILRCTVYSSGSSGNFPSGDMSGFGSFSGGYTTTTEEEEEEIDYIMDETSLCTIAKSETAEIEIAVDELDIMHITRGKTVTVTLDALPGESFEGTVSDIDSDGENSGGNTKYTVTVALPRNEKMLTGMNAVVRVEIGAYKDVLLIPSEALYEDSTGVFVYTAYDEKHDTLSGPVYVTTGLSDGSRVEILEGIAEGDAIFYRYADSLKYTFSR